MNSDIPSQVSRDFFLIRTSVLRHAVLSTILLRRTPLLPRFRCNRVTSRAPAGNGRRRSLHDGHKSNVPSPPSTMTYRGNNAIKMKNTRPCYHRVATVRITVAAEQCYYFIFVLFVNRMRSTSSIYKYHFVQYDIEVRSNNTPLQYNKPYVMRCCTRMASNEMLTHYENH